MTKKDAFASSKTAHPPNYFGEVREYLNTRFPGRWIGRVEPIAWPSRSLDLTILDFFFSVYVNHN
jgi:hypothetical protein